MRCRAARADRPRDGLLLACVILSGLGGALLALPFLVIGLAPGPASLEDGFALLLVHELSLYVLVAAAVCWVVWLAPWLRERPRSSR